MINANIKNDKFSYIKNHLEHYLEASPVSIYCKDKEGKYLTVNESCLNIFKRFSNTISSYNNIIGSTDFDHFDSGYSKIFRNNDHKVIISESPLIIMEINKFLEFNEERCFLSHKMPLRSRSGKIIGILGQSIQYEQLDTTLINSILYDIHKNPMNLIDFHTINHIRVKYQLTKRQTECVYHLSKGKTKREIAKILNLSIRTIETYWEQIKNKLNCNSRSHLIEILHEEH